MGSEECRAFDDLNPTHLLPSWVMPSLNNTTSNTRLPSLSSSTSSDVKDEDGNVCELSDPSYQAKTSAPSTCNTIHELGFSLWKMKFLSKGSSKMAWDVSLRMIDQGSKKEHFVMKTAVYSKIKASTTELDKNTRDALVMERAGRAPTSYESNVLAMYQYCAITNVVPFAAKQPLDKYIKSKKRVGASEMYHLALQAARGLYQMQAYKDGKATYAHADIKPQQFLLFDPPQDNQDNNEVPLLQLNDFNMGRYIKHSVTKNKKPCAFQMCGIHHKSSTYRSPEEYMDCADQSAAIDVFSLGSVFFFLLSNGLKPYYQTPYKKAVKNILDGVLPELPDRNDFKKRFNVSDELINFMVKRIEHPLFVALQDVMNRCMSLDPEDRPTSLEVVQMLEARLQKR